MQTLLASFVLVLVLLSGCGEPARVRPVEPDPPHALLGEAAEVRVDGASGALVAEAYGLLILAVAENPTFAELVVAQPDDGATVAGDADPVRFLWRDAAESADTWWITFRFGKASGGDLQILVPGGMPAEAALDPFAATMQAWTPSQDTWARIVKDAAGAPVDVTFVGFAATDPEAPLSQGSVRITVSGAR